MEAPVSSYELKSSLLSLTLTNISRGRCLGQFKPIGDNNGYWRGDGIAQHADGIVAKDKQGISLLLFLHDAFCLNGIRQIK